MLNISHLLVISNVVAGWKLIMGREDAKKRQLRSHEWEGPRGKFHFLPHLAEDPLANPPTNGSLPPKLMPGPALFPPLLPKA